jgi:triosephosphate isomerase
MNTTLDEAVALVGQVRVPLEKLSGIKGVLCPPFVSLAAVAGALQGSAVAVGAQNMHPETKGAFTGEISGAMLQGLCQYVIVGHSERRHLFGEKDEFVNRKVTAALDLGLTPILCVGETLAERDAGQAHDIVSAQLRLGLQGVGPEARATLVVAYEPVWAIGTGRAATGELAQEMMGLVRQALADLAGAEAAAEVPLLYGGSVTAENIAEFAALRDIDGALVGGASLRADEFVAIAKAIAELRKGSK